MEPKKHTTRPSVAILIALIDAALIFFTLQRELPSLKVEFAIPFPQIITVPGMWYNLAEVMFHSAGLIMVYGLISLLFPRLRFVLQLGAGLANLAGVPYLVSFIMSLRNNQYASNLQMAIFMFALCMVLPYLVMKLLGAVKTAPIR
jgi:hypothetical protein